MSESSTKKTTVVVTGGAGFIGSHLCERLLREHKRVICIDNFVTSHPRNIEGLMSNPDFEFLRLDVNNPLDLTSFPELEDFQIPFRGIQEIYHLACPTSIRNFDQFKIQTLLSNSLGNYHLLETAVKYRAKIFLCSSSVVYGSRGKERKFFSEEDIGTVDHLNPRSCYDEGKRFSETMFETYRQVHGIEIKIARLFRTYGPRMPLFDGHLIPDFVLNALEGKNLVIYGDEHFTTSLCYIDDVIDGCVRLMDSPSGTPPLNIGSDVDVKIVDVAKKIIEMTGSSSKIVFEKPLAFLTELGLPDIRKAKEFGWIPLTRLEEGLQNTIEDIQANKMILTTFGS